MNPDLRIVLVRPSHPGNIGAAARAMANMGLDQLVLVSPKVFPSEEATARASGADFILESARVVETLEEGLAGCQQVIATSARERALGWPPLDPPQAAAHLVEAGQRGQSAALVFGPERTGLSNAEIDLSNYLVRFPVSERLPSINLSMAVMLMCWEIRRLSVAPQAVAPAPREQSLPAEDMPSAEQMASFYAHLENALESVGFLKNKPPVKLMRKLVRLFNRAQPDTNELNILRGILTAMQHTADKANEAGSKNEH